MPLPIAGSLQDGRFLLLQTLGHGGTASVFGAFDRIEQRMVALKACSRGRSTGPGSPLSLEFDAWSRMRHPNVVEAYGMFTARRGPLPRGTPYLALEFVGGGPAHRALRAGRAESRTLGQLAGELLRALAHVHAEGLIHRDVKPSNVLVRELAPGRRRFLLTDFGLAARSGRRGRPGTISGSLPYVAPEVLLGGPVDGRADLYGLGISLYYLATGEMPARTRAVEGIIGWHLAGPPANPSARRPELSRRLARFIARLTARAPGQRPADCAEALRLLGQRADPPDPLRAGPRRALRARLRLALDATRLGARRRFALPPCPAQAAELDRQVRVWSAIHGLGFHRLATAGADRPPALTRLVLQLLVERGAAAMRGARRYELERLLPVQTLSGVPTWDRARQPGPAALAAERVGRFLLDCSATDSLVIRVTESARADPIASRVVRWLAGRLVRPEPDTRRGGLLLLLDPCFTSATRPDRRVPG